MVMQRGVQVRRWFLTHAHSQTCNNAIQSRHCIVSEGCHCQASNSSMGANSMMHYIVTSCDGFGTYTRSIDTCWFQASARHGHDFSIRYKNLREELAGICAAAGVDGPIVCPYDWRQPVKFVAEAWVAPRIWQYVGDKKKVWAPVKGWVPPATGGLAQVDCSGKVGTGM